MLGGGDVLFSHPHVWLPTFKLSLIFPLKKTKIYISITVSVKIPLIKVLFSITAIICTYCSRHA